VKLFKAFALATSLLFAASSAFSPAQTEGAIAPYPTMAPVDQYLIADRDAEIAMAKSAAPTAISNEAEVLVMGKDGYHTAIEGKNGFTCLVERSWMSPTGSPKFWNPKLRGPICYNPAATRSILPYTIYRTKLALSGLSKEAYFGDEAGNWHPHLMFHIPTANAASWGANLLDSPVLLNDEFQDELEPETIFMVTVGHWSDGTPATADDSASHKH
jgi:hypothetical protein